MIDAKLIDLEHIFVDGTKIEANANKYSFVWKKAVNNFDEKLHAKAKALVAEVRAITESETEPLTLEEQLMKTAVQLLTEVEDLEESIASETDKEKKKELKKLKTVKKNQAKTALEDETLAALYAGRKIDVKSVFGNLKGNLSFTRFLLRGLKKVRTEFGLVAMAHNLRKLAGHRLAISLKSANFTFFSFYRKTFINQITRKGVPRKVHYGLFRHSLN